MPDPSSLTIVIPTRNRPSQCAALIRFLRRQGVAHRIVIADSSDEAPAEALRAACDTLVDISRFATEIGPADKYAAAVETVDTPFVALLPDDDITFPHAIDSCREYLASHPDATAAQGYVLDFAQHQEIFDITGVRWFTPSIEHQDPLQRLYHLVRRYQPFFWSVFRREALLIALERARRQDLVCFQEMTFMATFVLLGKFVRPPCVYMLRGIEESLTSLAQTHPFYALLADSEGFSAHYNAYRDDLAAFIEATIDTPSLAPRELRHMLNLIHAICFRPALEGGPMEHTVQILFDPSMPPIVAPAIVPEFRKVGWSDSTIRSKHPGRRYVWRREVLNAEPRDEILIEAEERTRIARALEDYRGDLC